MLHFLVLFLSLYERHPGQIVIFFWLDLRSELMAILLVALQNIKKTIIPKSASQNYMFFMVIAP